MSDQNVGDSARPGVRTPFGLVWFGYLTLALTLYHDLSRARAIYYIIYTVSMGMRNQHDIDGGDILAYDMAKPEGRGCIIQLGDSVLKSPP